MLARVCAEAVAPKRLACVVDSTTVASPQRVCPPQRGCPSPRSGVGDASQDSPTSTLRGERSSLHLEVVTPEEYPQDITNQTPNRVRVGPKVDEVDAVPLESYQSRLAHHCDVSVLLGQLNP